MVGIIASIGIEQNWHIAQAEGVWAYRVKNAPGVKHASEMNAGDYILFYRGTAGAKAAHLPHGFVALGRLTENPERPWPSGIPVPWSDAEYGVRIPFELLEEFDPPIVLPFAGSGFNDDVGISRFDLLGGIIDDEQLEKIIGRSPPTASLPVPPTIDGPSPSAPLGVAYAEAKPGSNTSTKPFTVDPEKLERGQKGHADTQNALAHHLEDLGLKAREPNLSAGEPRYDVSWEHDGTIYVAEIKSITKGNQERQMRLGLGQVLWYRKLMQSKGKPTKAILVPESEPSVSTWAELCEELGVLVTWPGHFEVVDQEMGF